MVCVRLYDENFKLLLFSASGQRYTQDAMRMTVFVYEKIGFPLHQVSDHMLSMNTKKEVWTGIRHKGTRAQTA